MNKELLLRDHILQSVYGDVNTGHLLPYTLAFVFLILLTLSALIYGLRLTVKSFKTTAGRSYIKEA